MELCYFGICNRGFAMDCVILESGGFVMDWVFVLRTAIYSVLWLCNGIM